MEQTELPIKAGTNKARRYLLYIHSDYQLAIVVAIVVLVTLLGICADA